MTKDDEVVIDPIDLEDDRDRITEVVVTDPTKTEGTDFGKALKDVTITKNRKAKAKAEYKSSDSDIQKAKEEEVEPGIVDEDKSIDYERIGAQTTVQSALDYEFKLLNSSNRPDYGIVCHYDEKSFIEFTDGSELEASALFPLMDKLISSLIIESKGSIPQFAIADMRKCIAEDPTIFSTLGLNTIDLGRFYGMEAMRTSELLGHSLGVKLGKAFSTEFLEGDSFNEEVFNKSVNRLRTRLFSSLVPYNPKTDFNHSGVEAKDNDFIGKLDDEKTSRIFYGQYLTKVLDTIADKKSDRFIESLQSSTVHALYSSAREGQSFFENSVDLSKVQIPSAVSVTLRQIVFNNVSILRGFDEELSLATSDIPWTEKKIEDLILSGHNGHSELKDKFSVQSVSKADFDVPATAIIVKHLMSDQRFDKVVMDKIAKQTSIILNSMTQGIRAVSPDEEIDETIESFVSRFGFEYNSEAVDNYFTLWGEYSDMMAVFVSDIQLPSTIHPFSRTIIEDYDEYASTKGVPELLVLTSSLKNGGYDIISKQDRDKLASVLESSVGEIVDFVYTEDIVEYEQAYEVEYRAQFDMFYQLASMIDERSEVTFKIKRTNYASQFASALNALENISEETIKKFSLTSKKIKFPIMASFIASLTDLSSSSPSSQASNKIIFTFLNGTRSNIIKKGGLSKQFSKATDLIEYKGQLEAASNAIKSIAVAIKKIIFTVNGDDVMSLKEEKYKSKLDSFIPLISYAMVYNSMAEAVNLNFVSQAKPNLETGFYNDLESSFHNHLVTATAKVGDMGKGAAGPVIELVKKRGLIRESYRKMKTGNIWWSESLTNVDLVSLGASSSSFMSASTGLIKQLFFTTFIAKTLDEKSIDSILQDHGFLYPLLRLVNGGDEVNIGLGHSIRTVWKNAVKGWTEKLLDFKNFDFVAVHEKPSDSRYLHLLSLRVVDDTFNSLKLSSISTIIRKGRSLTSIERTVLGLDKEAEQLLDIASGSETPNNRNNLETDYLKSTSFSDFFNSSLD